MRPLDLIRCTSEGTELISADVWSQLASYMNVVLSGFVAPCKSAVLYSLEHNVSHMNEYVSTNIDKV